MKAACHASFSATVSRCAFFLIALTLSLASAGARADLIFADSFDYENGDLGGNGPPPGSPPGQGGWVTFNGSPKVPSSGLRFTDILYTGKSAGLTGLLDITADKAVAALGPVTAEDGVAWVGFLVRQAQVPDASGGFAVVSLGNNVTGPSVGIGMLYFKNRYGLDNNTGEKGARARTAVVPSQKTVWLVTKLDFVNAQEYLWVDPSPEVEPDIASANAKNPMTTEFVASGFSEIVLIIGYTDAVFQFDEVRVGTAFHDLANP